MKNKKIAVYVGDKLIGYTRDYTKSFSDQEKESKGWSDYKQRTKNLVITFKFRFFQNPVS